MNNDVAQFRLKSVQAHWMSSVQLSLITNVDLTRALFHPYLSLPHPANMTAVSVIIIMLSRVQRTLIMMVRRPLNSLGFAAGSSKVVDA